MVKSSVVISRGNGEKRHEGDRKNSSKGYTPHLERSSDMLLHSWAATNAKNVIMLQQLRKRK